MCFDKGLDNTSKTVSRVVAFLYGQTQPPVLVCFPRIFTRCAKSAGVIGGRLMQDKTVSDHGILNVFT